MGDDSFGILYPEDICDSSRLGQCPIYRHMTGTYVPRRHASAGDKFGLVYHGGICQRNTPSSRLHQSHHYMTSTFVARTSVCAWAFFLEMKNLRFRSRNTIFWPLQRCISLADQLYYRGTLLVLSLCLVSLFDQKRGSGFASLRLVTMEDPRQLKWVAERPRSVPVPTSEELNTSTRSNLTTLMASWLACWMQCQYIL
jgi:hypothetical protein